tara:strand:+ start:59 stop:370 length:312 start_codon:yes stop_codon:yes gene_type:complete
MPDYFNETATNNSEIYEHIFEVRGITSVVQHTTKDFSSLRRVKIEVRDHTWAFGDTLHKLAFKYFGRPEYWWRIGLVNGKPTDAHYNIGDKVMIPISPEKIRV